MTDGDSQRRRHFKHAGAIGGGALPGRLQKYRDALSESKPHIEDKVLSIVSSFPLFHSHGVPAFRRSLSSSAKSAVLAPS